MPSELPPPSLLRRFSSREFLDRIAGRLHGAAAVATVALSGGRIAGPFYDAIVALQRAGCEPRLAEYPVHFFFADERCVPPDHPESNFKTARLRLFEPLGIPADRAHRLRGEAAPEEAAAEAEQVLRSVTGTAADKTPALDLVILGMGEDGHVASLFPNAPDAVVASPRVYVPVLAPKPPPQRITLTYTALAAAREILVLVSGAGKARALAESLAPGGTSPLARVWQINSRLRVLAEASGS